MAAKFKKGDLVRLKSDNFKMIVDQVHENDAGEYECTCIWRNDANKIQTERHPEELLVNIDSPQPRGRKIIRA